MLFDQTSGFSQGGKLSGHGFCLCISVLLLKINCSKSLVRYNPLINKVRRVVTTTEKPCQGYADDAYTILSAEPQHLIKNISELVNIYKHFGKISALELNRKKSTLSFPLGIPDDDTCVELIELGFTHENITRDIKYLGYTLKDGDFQESVSNMITLRTEKVRMIAKAFNSGTAGLTPKGRVTIANSLLSSQLTNVIACAHGITKKRLKATQSAVLGFVNHKQIMRFDQSQLQRNRGGLGCPNLYLRYLSSKLSLLHKAIRTSSNPSNTTRDLPWVCLFRNVLKTIQVRAKDLPMAGIGDLIIVSRHFKLAGFPLFQELIDAYIISIRTQNCDGLHPNLRSPLLASRLKQREAKKKSREKKEEKSPVT